MKVSFLLQRNTHNFLIFLCFCVLFPSLSLFLLAPTTHTNLKVEQKISFTTIKPAYKVRSSRWQVLRIKGMKLNLWGTCTAQASLPVKTNTVSSNVTRKPEH